VVAGSISADLSDDRQGEVDSGDEREGATSTVPSSTLIGRDAETRYRIRPQLVQIQV